MTNTTDPLQAFCDPEFVRFDIRKPWVYDRWRYATNGVVCIRERCDEPNGSGKYPSACDLFKDFPVCDTPWPKCRCGECGKVLDEAKEKRNVGGCLIAAKYLQLIESLGGVRYGSPIAANAYHRAIPFVDGCGRQGLIMECAK